MARVRPVRIALGLAVAYGVLLAIGGLVLGGLVDRRARERIAAVLGAVVTIASSSFSLWRGRLEIDDLRATRPGGGLDLTIRSIEVSVAGWGAVVFDRDVDEVIVRGATLELSARGLADLATREREPIESRVVEIGRLVIEDARVAVAPSALLPGLGRVEARLARAEAAPVHLIGALSWLGGLARLDGEVSLPGGLGLAVGYVPGSLSVRGRWLAEMGLTLPFRLPAIDPAADEIEQLRAIAVEAARAAGGGLRGKAAGEAARRALEMLAD